MASTWIILIVLSFRTTCATHFNKIGKKARHSIEDISKINTGVLSLQEGQEVHPVGVFQIAYFCTKYLIF